MAKKPEKTVDGIQAIWFDVKQYEGEATPHLAGHSTGQKHEHVLFDSGIKPWGEPVVLLRAEDYRWLIDMAYRYESVSK